MSLKTFHLLFVTAAVLMTLFGAAEALTMYRADGRAVMAVAAAGGIAATALLIRFEVLFLRQCRKEGVR
jgi:hypothetical protein